MAKRDKKNEILTEKNKVLRPYFSLLLVLIITIGSTILFYQNAVNKDRLGFEKKAIRLHAHLKEGFSKKVFGLKAARYFFADSDNLGKNFDFPGKGETGFIKYVNNKKEGNGNWEDFIPFQNEKLKPWFEKTGFSKLNEIARKNEIYLTKFETNKDLKSQKNKFIVLEPLFENKREKNKTETNLKGFIYHIFYQSDLLENIFAETESENIGLSLEIDGKILLSQNISEVSAKNKIYSIEKNFEVFNLKGKINYFTDPAFNHDSKVFLTLLIPVLGVLVGVILFLLLRSETNSKRKLAEIAEELADWERERENLLEKEKKARNRAEQSVKIKDKFISLISHEIRTPLNSINGWANILQGENIDRETKKKALKTIRKNVRHQTKIIDDLLLFSEVTNQKKGVNFKLNGVSKIINEAIEDVIERVREENISLQKDNKLNGEKVYCDRNKLKKALVKLLQNALKFTPEGGVIKLEGRKKKDSLSLRISDSGPGIEKKSLPHIFDKFYQSDSSLTTRKYEGLGLGLSIASQIIKLHGGEIRVESGGEKQGAEFEILLPKAN